MRIRSCNYSSTQDHVSESGKVHCCNCAKWGAGPATTAWTHDFLNKKPWHPLNFRNQIKRFDAEQAAIAREKSEATAKAEFEAEQQYLETLAHMPSAEADKYRHMQGAAHSVMY